MIPVWLPATYQQCEYPGRMTINHWCSVDAHFQDEVGMVSLWFMLIKEANTTIMYNHDQINY